MDAQTTDVPTRRRVWIIAIILLALIAVLIAACEAMSPDQPTIGESPGGGDGSVVIGDRATFQIEGDATNVLTPGTESSLDLLLINTSSSDLTITELTVDVRSIDAPHADTDHPCSAADFEVRQLSSIDVLDLLPANSERTLKSLGLSVAALPAIVMLNHAVNQDGCQQATLALTYTGVGTVVKP